MPQTIYKTKEYFAIQKYYGNRKARRSQVPLINHINEGLIILKELEADLDTQKAFCLHPMFQEDVELLINFVDFRHYSSNVVALVMEYRNIANLYLSNRKINSLDEIDGPLLLETHQMLVADKIQNYKDFCKYHKWTHPRAIELESYFKNWLQKLEVSKEQQLRLIELIN